MGGSDGIRCRAGVGGVEGRFSDGRLQSNSGKINNGSDGFGTYRHHRNFNQTAPTKHWVVTGILMRVAIDDVLHSRQHLYPLINQWFDRPTKIEGERQRVLRLSEGGDSRIVVKKYH